MYKDEKKSFFYSSYKIVWTQTNPSKMTWVHRLTEHKLMKEA